MMELGDVLEALVFASPRPLETKDLLAMLRAAAAAAPENEEAAGLARHEAEEIALALAERARAGAGRPFRLAETAAGWRFESAPELALWLRQIFPEARPARISPSALETLAIVAYRQPVTRADIESVRGVAVDGVVQTLLDRGLLRIAGRADAPGRPLLYETTPAFLEHFGLRSLRELPNAPELRRPP